MDTNTHSSAFDLRPTAIRKWIEDLPLGSTGETSKQVYRALRAVNHQESSVEKKLQFLELTGPTLNILYPRLSKYFTNISLPLNKKTKNVLHVTTSLLVEVLKGYLSIVKRLLEKKPFGWKKPFALSLHRALIYYSQILCTQRLSYQPCIKGTWKQLYWCYQQADKLGLLSKSFTHCNDPKIKTTIEFEFKRLLLLSLLSANDLGQNNIQEVHNLMSLWIKNTDILKSEPINKKTCFTINLLSDVPPYLVGTRNDATRQTMDRHYLSTEKLQKLLSGYLNKLKDDDSIKVSKNTLSKDTIEALLNNWTRNVLRQAERKEGSGFVDVVTGMTAIHFVLNQQDQPVVDEVKKEEPDNSIDFESTLTIEPIQANNNDILGLDYFLGNQDKHEDVWEKVYETTLTEMIPEQNWTESGIFKVYKFARSILLDYSDTGYRLSVNDKSIDSLKHNELVAVREHALAPWVLTQVKWLHFSEKGDVQFGVNILSKNVLPVNVTYEANSTLSKPLPCLLGVDDSRLMLFVPKLPTKLIGRKLQLDHQTQHSHIQLKKKIFSTTTFDIFEILEPQQADKEHAAGNENFMKTPDELSLGDDKFWDSF